MSSSSIMGQAPVSSATPSTLSNGTNSKISSTSLSHRNGKIYEANVVETADKAKEVGLGKSTHSKNSFFNIIKEAIVNFVNFVKKFNKSKDLKFAIVTKDIELAIAQNDAIIKEFNNNPQMYVTEELMGGSGNITEIDALVKGDMTVEANNSDAILLFCALRRNLRTHITPQDINIINKFKDSGEMPQLDELSDLVQDVVGFAIKVIEHNREVTPESMALLLAHNCTSDPLQSPSSFIIERDNAQSLLASFLNQKSGSPVYEATVELELYQDNAALTKKLAELNSISDARSSMNQAFDEFNDIRESLDREMLIDQHKKQLNFNSRVDKAIDEFNQVVESFDKETHTNEIIDLSRQIIDLNGQVDELTTTHKNDFNTLSQELDRMSETVKNKSDEQISLEIDNKESEQPAITDLITEQTARMNTLENARDSSEIDWEFDESDK